MFSAMSGNGVRVLSAGVRPWQKVHPVAKKLMAEMGYSLEGKSPKDVRGFLHEDIDLLITIGDRAEAETPDFPPRTRRLHWPIDDPVRADGTDRSETAFPDASVPSQETV